MRARAGGVGGVRAAPAHHLAAGGRLHDVGAQRHGPRPHVAARSRVRR
ncbi:MAG: flagellar hook capping protein [Gemmatimonadetes bacterium]|nr:MAG: flagellar hook capping protein [Gemmatimonadota bacterium]